MKIVEVKENKKQYLDLLLLADEQEDMVDRYLDKGKMYVLDDIGAKCECVITDEGNGILEIKNIATVPEYQGKGYARALIEFVINNYRGKYSILQVGTGDSPLSIAAAVNYLSEHGISNLDELDASLSSVSDKAFSIREGMKTAEQRMKELQKLMEYGRNYQTYKPIQDEYRQIRWKGKQEKFAEARRAELTLWDAANRYLHANLPKGTKTLPIAEWEQEYADLKTQRDSDYTKLKETRAEVAELQKIRKCVDIALRADQPEQTRTKRHDIDR